MFPHCQSVQKVFEVPCGLQQRLLHRLQATAEMLLRYNTAAAPCRQPEHIYYMKDYKYIRLILFCLMLFRKSSSLMYAYNQQLADFLILINNVLLPKYIVFWEKNILLNHKYMGLFTMARCHNFNYLTSYKNSGVKFMLKQTKHTISFCLTAGKMLRKY